MSQVVLFKDNNPLRVSSVCSGSGGGVLNLVNKDTILVSINRRITLYFNDLERAVPVHRSYLYIGNWRGKCDLPGKGYNRFVTKGLCLRGLFSPFET